jgi:hypothetical protein
LTRRADDGSSGTVKEWYVLATETGSLEEGRAAGASVLILQQSKG